MDKDWCKYTGNKVLLVEGQNDCHVILALCQAYNIPETFGIYECGSDTGALKRLNALISGADAPSVIGIVLDADSPDLEERWKSVQGKLKNYDYSLPIAPDLTGTIVKSPSDYPGLGFWLMPNNRDPGMLEDFCMEMIDTDMIATVEQCLQIAEASGHTSFKSVHRSKAIVHTYLAWQDEPGLRLGQAITARVLRSNTQPAKVFAEWLTLLFRENNHNVA